MEHTVTITYETLYEILHREKDRLELQQLDATFFADVQSYLKEKELLVTGSSSDLFSIEEKQKATHQLINIKRILRELYEKREKKIIALALDKSRTRSELIDTARLLQEEKQMFDSLVSLFDRYRDGILMNLLEGVSTKMPDSTQEEPEASKQEEKPTKVVRFTHAVPRFVGLDGEEFGPFDEEDIASLPSEIVNVLISKDRAEEIKEE